MKLADVVERIDAVIAADNAAGGKLSDRSVSMTATGSTDTIRNWRRAVDAGKNGGATTPKIYAVATALGVSPSWLLTGEGDPTDSLPLQYHLLSPAHKAAVQTLIQGLLESQRDAER